MGRDPAELDRRRAERNAELLDRMRAGDPLQRPASESWFPPRPIIKKDRAEILRALGEELGPKDGVVVEVTQPDPGPSQGDGDDD